MELMLPLGFEVGGPDSNSYCKGWERCGCSGSMDWVELILPLGFEVGGPDSNSYCRGALGVLWLQWEHGLTGVDAPTRV